MHGQMVTHGTRSRQIQIIPPPRPPRRPKAWDLPDKDLQRLLATPDRRTAQGRRDAAVLAVLARTGVRRGELCRLTVGDFVVGPPATLTVATLKQRTKGATRTLPLTDATAALVVESLRGRTVTPASPMFLTLGKHGPHRPRAITPCAVAGVVVKALRRAKITDHVTPHSFRHSFATRTLQNGADLRTVQALLGHRSIAATEVYLHTTPTRLREAVSALGF